MVVIQAGTRNSPTSSPALLIGLNEYLMKARWNWIMYSNWYEEPGGVAWSDWVRVCLYDHMQTVWLHARMFMHEYQLRVEAAHACSLSHYPITSVHGVRECVIKAAAGRSVCPVQVAAAVLFHRSTGSCSLLSEGINLSFGLLYF